jgi:peptidoglycan hydrolase CwlO-like protein
MPPVKTVASPRDVDNEATAELPVLDVAAYEATLSDTIGNTDSWIPPAIAPAASIPAVDINAIPTLRPAEVEEIADLSGTHEMPTLATPNKILKATPAHLPRTETPLALPEARAAAETLPPPTLGTQVVVPPSPPLIEELRRALAAAECRVEELNERARIADAERAVAIARASSENRELREQLAGHLESLHTASGRLAAQRAEQPALEDELFARAARIEQLRKELAAQSHLLAVVRSELDASERLGAVVDADAASLRATVERRDARIAMLEADIAARHEREMVLAARLSEALELADPLAPALRGQISAREQQLRDLQVQLATALTLAAEKDADLQVAEESIRHLEIEVRDKTGKLEEASVTVEEWRAVIAESQRSILQRDNRIQQLEADLERRVAVAPDSPAQTGEEIALEGPARLLIRTDGNTNFVHVLGRRTRIGRGPDNELVLDTKHISRYHAVLLAGPAYTSIEDLNSTNGVFVNGKRVSRHALKDGDRVTIGRTQFRFSVRGN